MLGNINIARQINIKMPRGIDRRSVSTARNYVTIVPYFKYHTDKSLYHMPISNMTHPNNMLSYDKPI